MPDYLDLVGMGSLAAGGAPRSGAGDEPGPLAWDPEQYRRFAGPRFQPGLDLLSRVGLEAPRRIVDLGCGTGELTAMLAGRWPGATVTGVDLSEDMLAKARAEAGERIVLQRADIAEWRPEEPVDLLYSNATLHWVSDHAALFRRLTSFLADGGMLAIQMPRSWAQPSHRLMREVLTTGDDGVPFGSADLRRRLETPPVLEAADYLDLLRGDGREVDIWETEYLHVLEGEDPVLEWVKSTGLRPVLEGLGAGSRDRFLAAYGQRLREAYPRRDDGVTLFAFRRIFMTALRPAPHTAKKETP